MFYQKISSKLHQTLEIIFNDFCTLTQVNIKDTEQWHQKSYRPNLGCMSYVGEYKFEVFDSTVDCLRDYLT